MLQALLGRIRAPRYAQITISSENNKIRLHYTAQNTDGQQVVFDREYNGEIIQAQAISDLLSWLKHTAKTFFGSESGGL